MKRKKKFDRAREIARRVEKRAEERAAKAAASIGPHKLTDLEYEIYLLFEPGPRSADPQAIRTELESAVASGEGPGQEAPGGAPRPAMSLAEVEAAVAEVVRQGYIERVPGADADELWRFTPWGVAALDALRSALRWELPEWEDHGRARSRLTRLTAVPGLAPWEITSSFEDLNLKYMGLNTRTFNALYYAGILTVGQLIGMTVERLLDVKNVGPKAVAEIEARLAPVGLELGRPELLTGDAVVGKAQESAVDASWWDKPNLYQVFSRSGGFFDDTPQNHKERVLWWGPLMRLAAALDLLQNTADTVPAEARPLRDAFDTLIVLVEPSWWLRHSPGEFNRAEDQHFLGLLGDDEPPDSQGETFVQAIAAGRKATWQALEGIVTAAAEDVCAGEGSGGAVAGVRG